MTPFFSSIRLLKISAYGDSVSGSSITCEIDSDTAIFLDRGVTGNRLPALHIRLPEVVRITWATVTSTVALFTVSIPASTTGVLQATIEVRSPTAGSS
jgi:hypothetical protein